MGGNGRGGVHGVHGGLLFLPRGEFPPSTCTAACFTILTIMSHDWTNRAKKYWYKVLEAVDFCLFLGPVRMRRGGVYE